MSTPVLATKLYIPPPGPKIVHRPRLIERLNEGLCCKLTLISAPAGFGKTTLVSEWVASYGRPVAWLSLDEGDNNPARFLTYLIAALQTVAGEIGLGVSGVLQSPQPPPTELILTTLLNDIAAVPDNFFLILDDYHVIDAASVHKALAFLLKHLPPHVHLIVVTREDPALPLARLRAQGQMAEVRATGLSFTLSEATGFLNQAMGLDLSTDDIAALETRTEGWIAGLQLAALSLQGQQDPTSFIASFTGSHHFVLDYLAEEVLQQQPEHIQTFLLRTAILDRLCGSLCDAVLLDAAGSGREVLEYLERANLFIVPLDDERRWYRYHHLFADLLRQRLRQSIAASPEEAESRVNDLHLRASVWYEENGLEIEAFHHAVAAHDVDRAEHLTDSRGIPLHFRGAVTDILNWLASLPAAVLDARPWLWVRYASLLLVNGQTTGVEEKLQAAEIALRLDNIEAEADDKTRNLIGQIAATRATLALTRYQPETMIVQSRRALEYLHPSNLALRANANWTLGVAYLYQGERTAARQAIIEAISLSQSAGDIFTTILATIILGDIEEVENNLHLAAQIYRHVLQLAGDQPLQIIHEAHLGLARILYEWNDLDAAEQHGQQALYLAQQYDTVIDRFIICEVFLARLKLARGDVPGAAAMLAEASRSARQPHFAQRLPEVVAAQALTLLRQGDVAAAAQLAQAYDLPLVQARVYLAQGDSSTALTLLAGWCEQAEAKGWADEQLKAMILQAVALQMHGEKDNAMHVLGEALALAEPGGFIRLFADEGPTMAQHLSEAAARGMMPDYSRKLLAACEAEMPTRQDTLALPAQPLIEPLSPREVEVLGLIAQGLSNDEISKRLYLALDTVKGHNRKIFGKLQVQRRTEAVARARELGLL
jgi:LuxR family maltose regulon positive regulatory protein